MSNIKQVLIEGEVPYHLGDDFGSKTAADGKRLVELLAVTLRPSIGLKLEYQRGCRMVPNTHGGKTAMYRFKLHGDEALRYEFFDELCDKVVAVGGSVSKKSVIDIEM